MYSCVFPKKNKIPRVYALEDELSWFLSHSAYAPEICRFCIFSGLSLNIKFGQLTYIDALWIYIVFKFYENSWICLFTGFSRFHQICGLDWNFANLYRSNLSWYVHSNITKFAHYLLFLILYKLLVYYGVFFLVNFTLS